MQSYKIVLLIGVLAFVPLFGMSDCALRRSRGNSTIVQSIITNQADSPLGSRPHTPLEPNNIGFFENEHSEITESDCDCEQDRAFFDIQEQENTPAEAIAHKLLLSKQRPSRADRDQNWREKKPSSIVTLHKKTPKSPKSSPTQSPQKSFTLYSPKATSSPTQAASLVVATSAAELHQRKKTNRFADLSEEKV